MLACNAPLQEVYVGRDTERTVEGLKPGVAYGFRIQVVNVHGVATTEGPVTHAVTPLPIPDPPVPAGPPKACSVRLR